MFTATTALILERAPVEKFNRMCVLVVISVLLCLLHIKLLKIHNYWKNKGVPYVNFLYCFRDYAENMFRPNSSTGALKRIYEKYPNARYIGFYQFLHPILLIRDPALIKKITVKDFDSFTDHNSFITADIDSLWSKNIFNQSKNDGWHGTRSSISPFFTGNRMRTMLILMEECINNFLGYLKTKEKKVTVDVKELLSRYANDVIARTIFGVTCNSFKDKNNDFYMMVKESSTLSNLKGVAFFGFFFCPKLMKFLGIKVFNTKVDTFFRSLINESISIRAKNNIVHPDLIHLLMETRKLKMTEEVITANFLVIFIAGFEAVAYTLTNLLYELVSNPEVKQKLYNEIEETSLRCNGNFTFEVLRSMKYLNSVILEGLRLHPPAYLLDRKCVKPYIIEGNYPDEKSLYLEKNSCIWIMHGPIQTDANYYPDPEKFDPDRFSDENKHNNIPCTFLSFGSGPRKCVGSRFALLECKLLMVKLLLNYELERTKEHYPHNELWLELQRRT